MTTIEYDAFYKCSALTNVTFGENSQLTTIGNYAFNYCSKLTNIEIPSGVASIGQYAFSSNLKVLICHAENVPETDGNAFGYYANMTIYVPENSVEAYKSAVPWNEHEILPIGGVGFVNYENYTLKFIVTDSETKEFNVTCYIKPTVETELTIPSNVKIDNEEYTVTSVADSAFLNCSKFVGDLVLPNSVTSVGVRAFRDCVGFNGSLILSENLKTIKDLAFAGGEDEIVNYTGILNIPSSLTSIGSNAFQNAIGLTGIVVEEGNTVYDSRENCNAIVETSTNTLIFGCQNSTIPDGITSIGKSAFLNCSGFKNIELPNSLVSIGYGAFKNSGLTGELVIPNSVTTIEIYAFGDCSGLTGDLIIPNSVTYLGGAAFWECSGLNGKLTLSENIDTIFGYTFAAYNNEMHFTGDLIIPNKVKYIGDAAFQNCADLKHVGFDNIDESQLTFVGDWAFTLCSSLTSVEIPSGVKHIGKYGYNCEKLEEIRCYAENVPESEETIFENCPSSMKIYVPNASVSKYKTKQPWKKFMILPLNDAVSEELSSFNVYPNPVVDNLYIETDDNVDELTIYSITGVVVYHQTVDCGQNSLTIDASELNNGVYFVKIKSGNHEIIRKFIKK